MTVALPGVEPVQFPAPLKLGDALAVTAKMPAVVGTARLKVQVVFAVALVSVGFALVQSGLRLTHFVSFEVVTVSDAAPPEP